MTFSFHCNAMTPLWLREGHIDILNGLVDFGCTLIADSHAIDAGLPERKLHGFLPVLTVERALANKLHGDYAHSFFANFCYVADNFGDVPQPWRGVILRVHALALVIYPDHSEVEPVIPRHLTQRGRPMDRRTMAHDHLPRFRLQNRVLPPRRIGWPGSGVLPMQQHDVEILCIRQLAQLVPFLLRIHPIARGHFRHQLIAVPWNALQRYAEHLVHFAIRLGGLEKADAAVVGIPHQARKSILPEFSLYLAAEAAGTKGKPG